MAWILWFALPVTAVVIAFGLADVRRRYTRRGLYARLTRSRGFRETASVADPDVASAVPEIAVSTCHVTAERNALRLDVFENLEHDVEPGAPTETQTMIAVAVPDIEVPQFVIDPRSVPVEVKMKIEMQEGITVSGEPEFTAYNVVTAPDAERIRQVLKLADITSLLYGNRSLTVESRGHYLVFFEAEHLMSERRIMQVCDAAATFAQRVQHVLKTGTAVEGTPPAPIAKEVH